MDGMEQNLTAHRGGNLNKTRLALLNTNKI